MTLMARASLRAGTSSLECPRHAVSGYRARGHSALIYGRVSFGRRKRATLPAAHWDKKRQMDSDEGFISCFFANKMPTGKETLLV